ncbi:MAG: hypothetical protein QM770_20140 [Tepidisphaeraceae bacterium]
MPEESAPPTAPHLDLAWRIVRGITNDDTAASPALAWLIERHPATDDDDALDRWFKHHAMLYARDVVRRRGYVVPTGGSDLATQAFDRAIAQLEPQQREAWLLSVGERFAVRQIGIAMDCSQTAALTHLQGAEKMLRTVAGDAYDVQAERITKRWRDTTPPADVLARAQRRRSRTMRWRRVRKAFTRIVFALVTAVVVWQFIATGMAAWTWAFIQSLDLGRFLPRR